MPRTTTLESPGCPPLRALTVDALGLIKVVESRNGGAASMVERWGEPDASKYVLTVSILDREHDPLLGIARKNGSVELMNAINGNIHAQIPDLCQVAEGDDAIVGLHLFKTQRLESTSRSCAMLTCTKKGHSIIESVELGGGPDEFIRDPSPSNWTVSGSGNIFFAKVDGTENYALYGGKGVEVNVWDLQKCDKIWTAKSPPKNSLDIFTPTWFTSASFLSKDDHRKFVAGTNSNQVRLYDISSQRRPVMSIDFRDTPIKAIAEDNDGHTIYIGNGSGDLASIDLRTGKLLGCFIGKCSGSIRSIVRHPQLPVIASCGLDSYMRIWDIQSRQLLSAVFLKQALTDVVFDSHFRTEEVTTLEPQNITAVETIEEVVVPAKRKKPARERDGSKKKLKSKHKSKKRSQSDEEED